MQKMKLPVLFDGFPSPPQPLCPIKGSVKSASSLPHPRHLRPTKGTLIRILSPPTPNTCALPKVLYRLHLHSPRPR